MRVPHGCHGLRAFTRAARRTTASETYVIYSHKKNPFPVGNPLANALVVIVGTVMIGLSLILGFFAFIAIGSVVLVMAAIIGIRIWWLQRRLRKEGVLRPDAPEASGGSIEIIEGEYRVVSRDSRDDDRHG